MPVKTTLFHRGIGTALGHGNSCFCLLQLCQNHNLRVMINLKQTLSLNLSYLDSKGYSKFKVYGSRAYISSKD